MFNRRQQNFRIQKQNPALILARKHDNFVLPAPQGFGLDAQKNYYFSHMYNCIYDCRYCFLQGMYSSANYVLFVNYEDFFKAISDTIDKNTDTSLTFFSGYDCDSLAFEKITGFAEKALEFFTNFSSVELELRTKSIVSETLLKRSPISNCIVAYSLSPSNLAGVLDNKAPSIERRVNALKTLAKNGWPVGLRFDPLIYCSGWENLYSELIQDIFTDINIDKVHSVSHGPLRFPKEMYKKRNAVSQDQVSVKKMRRERTDKRDEVIYCVIECKDEGCLGKVKSIMNDPKAVSLLSKCCGIKAPQFPTMYQDDNSLYFAKIIN